jgi:hypothetical protein
MTRTKSPRIPSYRLHTPSGQAVVRLDGRDVYLGTHGSVNSQEKYQRTIEQWLARCRVAFRNSQQQDVIDLTLNELICHYWRFVENYYVKNDHPTGEQQAIRYALRPVRQLYGSSLVREFGPLALKAVRQAMVDAGYCRKLVNARINRIRRMFKWAVENELVDAGVLHGLQAVSPLKRGRCGVRESEAVKPVSQHLIDAVTPFVTSPVRAMIQLQLLIRLTR